MNMFMLALVIGLILSGDRLIASMLTITFLAYGLVSKE